MEKDNIVVFSTLSAMQASLAGRGRDKILDALTDPLRTVAQQLVAALTRLHLPLDLS